MSKAWLEQSERSTTIALRFIRWAALTLGRPITRLMLHPICWYFLLFSPKARRASKKYLKLILNKKPSIADLYKHYFYFSSTILDRVFMLAEKNDVFSIKENGFKELLTRIKNKEGCILLGAHLGSFEVLRTNAHFDSRIPFKILMHKSATQKLNVYLNALAPSIADSIIEIGKPESLLAVKEALEQGYLVGLLADRIIQEDKSTSCQFLGKTAQLPTGPMLLASLTKAPTYLFFGLYKGGNQYEIKIEKFAEEVTIGRKTREKDLQSWTQRYAQRLEYYCKNNVFNWFNFYDYWHEE